MSDDLVTETVLSTSETVTVPEWNPEDYLEFMRLKTAAKQPAVATNNRSAATVTVKGRNQGKSKTVFHDFKMETIDALETNRQAIIYPLRDETCKLKDSIARRNWCLYGNGDVTVVQFLKRYPSQDGGTNRARGSLLWDLNRNLIGIVGVNIDEAPKA